MKKQLLLIILILCYPSQYYPAVEDFSKIEDAITLGQRIRAKMIITLSKITNENDRQKYNQEFTKNLIYYLNNNKLNFLFPKVNPSHKIYSDLLVHGEELLKYKTEKPEIIQELLKKYNLVEINDSIELN